LPTVDGELCLADTVGILRQLGAALPVQRGPRMARTVRVDAVRAALHGQFRACRNAPGDSASRRPVVVEHGDSGGVERKTVPAGGFFLHPAGRELDVNLGGDLNTVCAILTVDQVEQAAQGSRVRSRRRCVPMTR
jgi:AraC family transcriptional regulator